MPAHYYQTTNADTREHQIIDSRTDEIVLQGETYQITSNVLEALNYPERAPWSECTEVAEAIREHQNQTRAAVQEATHARYDDGPQDTRDI